MDLRGLFEDGRTKYVITDITSGNKIERARAHSLTVTDSPLCVPVLFIRLPDI